MDQDAPGLPGYTSTAASQFPAAPEWPGLQREAPETEPSYRFSMPGEPAPTDGAGLLQAIGALEEAHRTLPYEFARLKALDGLSADGRAALLGLLSLPAPAREAVRQVLALPDELHSLVAGVVRLPLEVQGTLRVLLA